MLFFISQTVFGQSADEIMTKAKIEAKSGKKNIMLIFHASWCGWCKKFDKAMDASLVKSFFDANYVRLHFTVKESEKNKDLETVGAENYLKKFAGEKSGLPFWVILDEDGKLVGSSIVNGNNLGCPADKNEVNEFITVLNKTAKVIKAPEEKIKEVFIIQ